MKLLRSFQIFDLITQSVWLAGVILPAILALVYDPGFLILSLFSLLPLGGWQLIAALLLGYGLDDRYRRLYLITAIAFSSLFFSVSAFIYQLGLRVQHDFTEIAFFIAIFISFVAAVVYFIYSFQYFWKGDNPEYL